MCFAATALVMFDFVVAKRRIAIRLDISPLRSEATMTFLDGALPLATMIGMALNAAYGWWWAETAARLLIRVVAGREAYENWSEATELAND